MDVSFYTLWSDDDETEAWFRKHGRPQGIEIDGDVCGFVEVAHDADGYRDGFEIYLEHEELDVDSMTGERYQTAGAARQAIRRLVREHGREARRQEDSVRRDAAVGQQQLFEVTA